MDSTTKANINLMAVLSNLPALCEMDTEASRMIRENHLVMQLEIRNGLMAHLCFDSGGCLFLRGKAPKADIWLRFKDGDHLNRMFDGKANPGIKKGLTKIKFLTGAFTQLTERLAYYLKPTDELLKDADYFKINAHLTFHTAFYALCEIANSDKIGKINAKSVPPGTVNIIVEGGPSMSIIVDSAHHFSAKETIAEQPRAKMVFGSIQTASDILNGKTDLYTEIGKETFCISGFIPMIDNAGRILNQVSAYLR